MTINDPTNSASRPFGRDALDALRYLLRNRFVILAIAAAAIGLALKFNWGWLVAAGIAPIILGYNDSDVPALLEKARANMKQAVEQAPDGSVVAQTIYDAVTDDSTKLRYTVNTKGILAARKLLPDRIFFSLIRKVILR